MKKVRIVRKASKKQIILFTLASIITVGLVGWFVAHQVAVANDRARFEAVSKKINNSEPVG
jgi:hypothetical protein